METTMLLDQLSQSFSVVIKVSNEIESTLFFNKPKTEKWSVAEQLQHLSLSIAPINNLLSQPELLTKRWGASNRKSRDIQPFLNDYHKATSGLEWKAFPPFVPKIENESEKYAALHYTSDETKIQDFYTLTGNQIELLRDKFQITDSTEKQEIIETFKQQSDYLLTSSRKMDDIQMDTIQLPLPYIGLVTLKEILYFTLNHTNHHFNAIQQQSVI